MPDIPNLAATPNPADAQDPNLLAEAGKATVPSVLDDAAKQAQEAKEAKAAEEKRLLEADETTLSDEDKAKKAVIVKTKADVKVKTDADAKAKGIPEKYEFKVPEGITINQAAIDAITPTFKEMGLSQVNAQKLVDKFMEIRKIETDVQAADFKKFLTDSYNETVKALGKDYKEQLVYVAKVRDKFLSEETREMLDATGLSNNLSLIKDLINLGKLISEDKLADGKREIPGAGRTPATTMYPEQGKT